MFVFPLIVVRLLINVNRILLTCFSAGALRVEVSVLLLLLLRMVHQQNRRRYFPLPLAICITHQVCLLVAGDTLVVQPSGLTYLAVIKLYTEEQHGDVIVRLYHIPASVYYFVLQVPFFRRVWPLEPPDLDCGGIGSTQQAQTCCTRENHPVEVLLSCRTRVGQAMARAASHC